MYGVVQSQSLRVIRIPRRARWEDPKTSRLGGARVVIGAITEESRISEGRIGEGEKKKKRVMERKGKDCGRTRKRDKKKRA